MGRKSSGKVSSTPEYTVEAVLDKSTVDGITYYLLKWEGYSHDDNTWEPESNCDCKDLIAEFERNQKVVSPAKVSSAKSSPAKPSSAMSSPAQSSPAKRSSPTKDTPSSPQTPSFKSPKKPRLTTPRSPAAVALWDSQNVVVELVSRNNSSDLLLVTVKWPDDSMKSRTITNREAHIRCPQALIHFYEKHLRFRGGTPEPSSESKESL